MRPYRTPSRRTIQRASSGRFRKSTLADIGMACCEACGAIFTPDFDKANGPSGVVDPLVIRDLQRLCDYCRDGSHH